MYLHSNDVDLMSREI